MNLETIQAQLKGLRLSVAAAEIESVLANQNKAVSLGWVSELLQREQDARRENTLRARIRSARFPGVTTLEGFDFSFNPDIDEQKILEIQK